MAKRSGNKAAAGWNPRMLGLVLCAFFVLGVMTGFSSVGRAVALRVSGLIYSFTGKIPHLPTRHDSTEWLSARLDALQARIGIRFMSLHRQTSGAPAGGAVAMVERHDGFYALFADGELRGPVSPNTAEDLPVLSGPQVENARGGELVEFAALMVRAEAQLSNLVSEMSVAEDGTASLYLASARTAVVIDLDEAPTELAHATEILGKWRGREQMIAAIDMTTPGEAIVRLAEAASPTTGGTVRKISDRASGKPRVHR
ncbi:MAG: cell division protein FtsQ/DivIB [Candidatus Binataceae bacterium]